jgi:hypothetical protein
VQAQTGSTSRSNEPTASGGYTAPSHWESRRAALSPGSTRGAQTSQADGRRTLTGENRDAALYLQSIGRRTSQGTGGNRDAVPSQSEGRRTSLTLNMYADAVGPAPGPLAGPGQIQVDQPVYPPVGGGPLSPERAQARRTVTSGSQVTNEFDFAPPRSSPLSPASQGRRGSAGNR